jgi:O-Antigen ligase
VITADDVAIPQVVRRPSPQRPTSPTFAPATRAQSFSRFPANTVALVQFRERLLLFVIYITVLTSSVAFIEPSPHDALMGVLALTCLIANVSFNRKVATLFLLLLIWNGGGLLSLMNVPDQEKTIQYTGTSIYLSVAAIMWACIFAQNTMTRLSVMRSAYVLTAFIIAIAGICGYLSAFPGAHHLFAPNDRALGAFKDPNVFGPFLIWPALVVLERMLVRRITLIDVLIISVLGAALFVAFSRGAWFHFGLSCLVMIILALLTAKQTSTRMRIIVMAMIAIAVLAALVIVLLSIPVIHQMFTERAHLFESYDVGQGGRFRLQELALPDVLKYPNGMGPFGFASTHTTQQHNVYLQAFLVYGWIGGVTYILLLLTTFWVAVRSVFIPTPWQPYLITALAAFTGEVAEGFVIDSDHWRHFFLLLGIIWGLWAATLRYVRRNKSVLMLARVDAVTH